MFKCKTLTFLNGFNKIIPAIASGQHVSETKCIEAAFQRSFPWHLWSTCIHHSTIDFDFNWDTSRAIVFSGGFFVQQTCCDYLGFRFKKSPISRNWQNGSSFFIDVHRLFWHEVAWKSSGPLQGETCLELGMCHFRD